MKYRLRLLRPTMATNAYGEDTVTYIETVTVHAERVKMGGRQSEAVQEHFPDYSVEFNIRDAHEVAENWRCQQLGGHLYTITNITPNIERGFLTLTCERVNE